MVNFILKKYGLPVLLTLATSSLTAQGVITTPRTPSPAATLTQTIGISTVTVSYSRPSVKGREVWGKLVPYGYNIQGFGAGNRAPWRAGANENTVLTLSHPAKIQDHDIPAGSYGLFIAVNDENSAELIISKDYRSWGSFWYDSTHDLFRTGIKVVDHEPTELLTYDFINLNKNSADLVLNWEKKQFPIKITFDVDGIVMANAADQLKNTVGFSWQGYASAANYALANNTNLDQAVKWADIAIAQNKTYTTLMLKSNVLNAEGKTAESKQMEKEALAVATEVEMNAYGYQLLNLKQYDKAIEVLKLNAQRHPESANVWDSLGEAYSIKGDKKNAIENLKKSLSLNPPANVKANSQKLLKDLGAL